MPIRSKPSQTKETPMLLPPRTILDVKLRRSEDLLSKQIATIITCKDGVVFAAKGDGLINTFLSREKDIESKNYGNNGMHIFGIADSSGSANEIREAMIRAWSRLEDLFSLRDTPVQVFIKLFNRLARQSMDSRNSELILAADMVFIDINMNQGISFSRINHLGNFASVSNDDLIILGCYNEETKTMFSIKMQQIKPIRKTAKTVAKSLELFLNKKEFCSGPVSMMILGPT